MDEREIEFLKVRVSYLERLVLALIHELETSVANGTAGEVEREMRRSSMLMSDGHAAWHELMGRAVAGDREGDATTCPERFTEGQERTQAVASILGELWYPPRFTRPDL
ncbi:hypothetical protein ATO13_22141 [Stappia sp. 22II-S9-Z10]|nr:hypothetical protein ATO13_22141 [Stappia sp. 22II-S9-Z10]